MRAIELFSCFAFLAALSSGVEFQCRFEDIYWGPAIGSTYTCAATVTNVEDPTNVTNIVGNHLEGRNNSDVNGFYIEFEEILTTIPNGIENFFADLEVFQWWFGNISTIDSTPFKPFPNLIYIELFINKLVSLDGDLFQYTPKLRQIGLHSNLLQHVGHDLMTDLTDLVDAGFLNNPCINVYANTPQQIEELNLQLPIQCPPLATTPDPLTTTISTTPEPNECPDTCTLDENAQEMRARIEEFERRLSELEGSP